MDAGDQPTGESMHESLRQRPGSNPGRSVVDGRIAMAVRAMTQVSCTPLLRPMIKAPEIEIPHGVATRRHDEDGLHAVSVALRREPSDREARWSARASAEANLRRSAKAEAGVQGGGLSGGLSPSGWDPAWQPPRSPVIRATRENRAMQALADRRS